MALNASKVATKSAKIPPLDAGAYPGRLAQVIDLGLQPQEYKGEAKDPKRAILTTYELSDEFLKNEDGEELKDKPRWFSEDFPLNHIKSEKSTSTKRYLAIDPTLKHGGDWAANLGAPVMITLVQNPSKKDSSVVYNNIASIGPMRAKDAEKLPPLVNPTKIFDLEEPDLEVFNSLPEYVQNKITSNLEFNGSKLQKLLDKGSPGVSVSKNDAVGGVTAEDIDDEIPY